jgi:hypothetical protein
MPEMRKQVHRRANPDLRELIVEASLSLARLDADRLDELALSCQALNRDMVPSSGEGRMKLARQAQQAAGEMAVFARVIEATRANLDVLNRQRGEMLEYGIAGRANIDRQGQRCGTGSSDGNY